MRTARSLVMGICLLLAAYAGSAQQLRLGTTPYSAEKSAVLELQSDRQGLLLCRISDTALINTMSPPDGMLIYFTPSKQTMIRANGYWKALAHSTSTIASLNGLTGNTQTFATGATGTDFNISSSGTEHTFNIPDAGAAARGVVSTGAQTIAGSKTFSSAPLFSSLTAGSVPFIGTGGLLSQNNANLFWDATNNRLGVGTNAPSTSLHLSASNGNVLYLQTLLGGGTGTANILFKTYTGSANPTAQIGVLDDASYSSHITFSTKTSGADANALAERVRISSAGNVGIGTTAPSRKLDVNGAIVSSATTYPNYAYNSANRMAFGESNVPANETGSVVQFGSGSNTRNMVFAFTKTNVNTSYFGNDGTQMMLGSESTVPITFRTGLVYTAANIMSSGTEVMRLTNTGNLGIGTTAPSTKLHIVGANPLTLTGVADGTSTSADSILTITSGLVRKLPISTFASAFTTGNLTESGSGVLTITGGTNAVTGSGTTIQVKQANASQNGFLSSADWSAFNSKLSSVDTTNISNFYLKTRSLFSAGTGITYNASTGVISSSLSTGSFWAMGGNAVASAQNIGTTSNYDLPFITNNTERMRLSSTGNLGIGTSSFNATYPEKLVVDAGTTTSVNAIVGKGSIDSYLQLNIQNQSSGTSASSDVVATANNGSETANYIDMGINGGSYSGGVMGSSNDAYLYNIGQNLLIGTGSASKSVVFMTGGTAQGTNERMRIDGSGNVGIATTSPSAKLDVNGSFKLGTTGTVLTGMFKTSVSITDNSNNIVYTQSLTKTVTVTGAAVNANVIVTPRSALPNGVGIAWARVSSAGSVQINFTNSGAGIGGNQLLGTITFDITIIQ